MALFQQIKEILGLNSGESDTETPSRNAGDTENVAVTVEHEPDTESEDAVKGTGADSTGSSTEETSTDVEAATAESDESVESEAAETGETASDTETEESASAPTGSAGTEDVQSISGIGPAYAERLLADQFSYNFFATLDYASQIRVALKYIAENDAGARVGYFGPGGTLTSDPMGGPIPNYAESLDIEFDSEPIIMPHTASSATSQMQEARTRDWDYAVYHGIAAPYNLIVQARADIFPELKTASTTWCVDESWLAETPELYEDQIWVSGFKTLAEARSAGSKGADAVDSALTEYRNPDNPEVANLQYVRGFIHALMLRQGIHNAMDAGLDPSKGQNIRQGLLEIDDWSVWGLSEPFTLDENDRRPTMRGRVYTASDGELNHEQTMELPRNMDWIEYWNENL